MKWASLGVRLFTLLRSPSFACPAANLGDIDVEEVEHAPKCVVDHLGKRAEKAGTGG
jgi:hypothetical protein